MQLEVNEIMDLNVAGVVEKLLNNKFLSDVQFLVEEKTIYAHSMILMARSVKFQKQLILNTSKCETMTMDAKYESVYEFIKFLYTDDCDVNTTNIIDLMKLARGYAVPKLENYIIGKCSRRMCLSLLLYQYSIEADYELISISFKEYIASNYRECIKSNIFPILSFEVIKLILNFHRAAEEISEIDVLNGLISWLKRNHTTLSNMKRDKLFELIHFPLITLNQLADCATINSKIFTEIELKSFFNKILTKSEKTSELFSDNETNLSLDHERITGSDYNTFKTVFTVQQNILLTGIRVGNSYRENGGLEVTISSNDPLESLTILVEGVKSVYQIISFGKSIKLVTEREYCIEFRYLDHPFVDVRCSPENHELLLSELGVMQFEEIGKNLFEMSFITI